MFARMEKSSEFHRKWEALIEKKYNADEIRQRILNGDGGSWIRESYDSETIFQLDRFHIYKTPSKEELETGKPRKPLRSYLNQGRLKSCWTTSRPMHAV